MATLTAVARPDLHMVRGATIPAAVTDAVRDKTSNVAFGTHLFGFVKHDYRLPDPATAINVTAKWTTKSETSNELEELTHWWQQVATDAYDLEPGMVRFDSYRVIGEDALIIHEVFDDTYELDDDRTDLASRRGSEWCAGGVSGQGAIDVSITS